MYVKAAHMYVTHVTPKRLLTRFFMSPLWGMTCRHMTPC